MVFVYTTCPTDEEAKKIANLLISKKLISAANYFPTRSIYSSEKPTEATEWILILHTEDEKSGEVAEEVGEMHSYALPVIAKIPVTFNRDYIDWMYEQLR